MSSDHLSVTNSAAIPVQNLTRPNSNAAEKMLWYLKISGLGVCLLGIVYGLVR